MSSIQTSTFLRRVLVLDAVSCAGMGLLLLTCSGWLAELLSLPAGLLSEAALVLLPFAMLLAFLSTRARLPRFAVWAVIVVNAIWAIDSIVLLFTGWVQPNLLGYLFVAGQGAFVAVIAELEYVGLRKSPTVTPVSA
ncbi:hypothetical protein JM946_22140 [Steroidobacter sp. S1-65]|uniref:Uncharacterized protein n=1 Tax=Steroidobacter gossypii TaxID=2805490 RepID=A0ABS1X2J4_9GAMM|nr:hypothetical protein [Steroidobacter gossypii]MBM0107450.1 hypothetical protein [Steroidobacter gossypii]